MYELIRVSESSYYMDCPAKVGFYKTSENEVVLIDSGSDKDAAKKVKKLLDSQGWELKAVFNTHSHADHIGGNQYLQAQTECAVYAPKTEKAVTENPVLEPAVLYGGFPMQELRSKFLMAKESAVCELTGDVLPQGLHLISLPGHSYDMVGFATDDGVVFLADSLSGAETLEKYQIGFLYDVKSYLETLETVKKMKAECFVPSHAEPTSDIVPLAQLNIDKTLEIAEKITGMLSSPKTFDELLRDVFDCFGLSMNLPQRMLVGSTVKSYLSYLKELNRVDYSFENSLMLWRRV